MELPPEQQVLESFEPLKKLADEYRPSQRRRKRSSRGNRRSRSLVHVDRSTKELLAEMSKASGAPQVQLISYAVQTLGRAMQAEAVAAEQAEANKFAEQGEQLANDSEARGE